MTCRMGDPKCGLAKLGCHTIELRGSPYEVVKNSIKYRSDQSDPLFMLKKGEFDVVVVGEAPGAKEDQRGVPFQFKAGEKLIELIDNSGLDTSRVYCTNIVRCRPPGNRKPSTKEITACLPYLHAEIKALEPKVVMLLGATALRAFNLDKIGNITSIRGSVHTKRLPNDDEGPEFTVIPTLHPMALMYQKDDRMEARVIDDYRRAASIITGDNQDSFYNPEYTVVKTIRQFDEVMDQVDEVDMFAFDTGSRGLEFWKEPLIMVQLCWGYPGGKTAVIPWYHTCEENDPDRLAPWLLKKCWTKEEKHHIKLRLKKLLENPKITKSLHNSKHDLNYVRKHLNIKVKGFILDTMTMHHLLWEHRPHGLEYLADQEYKYGDYSFPIRELVGHGKVKKPFDILPNETFWRYEATDAEATYRLALLYLSRLQAKPNLWQLYCDETEPGIRSLGEAEWNGIKVNVLVAERLIKQCDEREEELVKLCRGVTSPDFNPGSYEQVANALIELGFGEKIRHDREPNKYTTSANKLNNIKKKCPLAGWVLEYRHVHKMSSTYMRPVLEQMDHNQRFHPGFMQHGTKTGRLAAAILHQVERLDDVKTENNEEQMRHMYEAEETYDYVHLDFSQVELKIMGLVSGDQELMKAIEGDLHSETAATFLGLTMEEFKAHPFMKYNRSGVGKRINFGIGYGSKGHSLVNTGTYKDEKGVIKNITWEMLGDGMARWRERFHKTSDFMDNVPERVRNARGVATNVFGRERRFGDELWSPDKKVCSEAEREALNYYIQSVAGSLMNRLINKIHHRIEVYVAAGHMKEDDIRLVNTVHDSGGWECRKYLTEWFVKLLESVSGEPVPELDNYQFTVDIGIGDCWASAEMNS